MQVGDSDCGPEGWGFEPWIALLNSGFALTLRSSSDAGQRFVNACERAALPGASSRISSEPALPRHEASRFQASLRASVEVTSQGKR